jgi:DNA-binding response OmpR family regulator
MSARSGYLLGSIPILAFIGVVFFRLGKPAKRLKELPAQDSDLVPLGSFLFDTRNRKLMMHETVIDLTATESRVLRIFALSPNVAVERSRIQKEIWEDEGVIVGRSLDVFISKLRKKLELDERVKIVVIRGMGYRLEVG